MPRGLEVFLILGLKEKYKSDRKQLLMKLMFRNIQVLPSIILFLSIASCASFDQSGNSNNGYESSLKSSVVVCANHHVTNGVQSNEEFYIIDSQKLSYLIVVASSALSKQDSLSPFCHIDKLNQSLVYANGLKPFVGTGQQSEEYQQRYASVMADRARIGRANIFQFKLINGIWRYIESRKVLSS